MESEYEQKVKENDVPVKVKKPLSKPLLIVITSIVTAIFIFLGFFIYHRKVVDDKDFVIQTLTYKNADMSNQINDLNNQLTDSNKKIDELSCNGVWDATQGCLKDQLVLISPNGGGSYCIGDTVPIKWKGPKDMESVSIWLATPNTGSVNLGEYLAVNNVDGNTGYGEYDWKGTNVIGDKVVAKDFYKINVFTTYKGTKMQDSSDSIFSLKNCQ